MDPLSQMRDIIEPESVSNSFGLLAVPIMLLVALLLLVIYRFLRHRNRRLAAQQSALLQLQTIEFSDIHIAQRINDLLKRCFKVYHPQAKALLSNQQLWLTELNKIQPTELPIEQWLTSHYRGESLDASQIEQLKLWSIAIVNKLPSLRVTDV
ncbi:DUF4381 family protein [Paraferrimonas haliotis]|uniref:DUF4381 domain-containing protein n=1 Tax=Paraferrimonas haliotis TaxID=2013866 RepID=A0AA37WVI6_9GAMM|nr:DUF4381 family protein [Paraferrimonas haliotis]GLS82623.1 hypothetical protein GCM10007894_06000 [Paraferrimonas haliotis]